MTTFGHLIAAAGSDDTVRIYDSVTGALRLLLRPGSPVIAMEGSPRGDLLYCTHSGRASISLWDIQTGALIHTFILDRCTETIAISPEGHYFAYISDKYGGHLKVLEVGTDVECTPSNVPDRVYHLCWLQPEGWLAAAVGGSVGIWDLFAGRLHRSFQSREGACGLAYSRKIDRLAFLEKSYNYAFGVTIVNPRTGASTTILSIRQPLTCVTFSQTTGEIISGTAAHGLQLLDISTQGWKNLGVFRDWITSVSSLPDGIVVANVRDSGIQLWDLDEPCTSPRQPTTPEFTVAAFGKDKIVCTIPTGHGHGNFTLLEPTTMSQLCTIPAPSPFNGCGNSVILCASLEQRMVVSTSNRYLELWIFGSKSPRWAAGPYQTRALMCGVSPRGNRLVVFDSKSGCQGRIHVLNNQNGQSQATLLVPEGGHPLEIEFESEDRFCSLHNDHRIPYVVSPESEPGGSSHLLIRHEALPLVERPRRRCYDVDEDCEWVVSGSKRICWIPPGYILDSNQHDPAYCWAGDSLFMGGRDGVLRKFTFSGQS